MSAAAAAVIAQRAQMAQEEEEMTPYTPQDLAEHWEFKILRSAAGQFRDPVWLRGILEEEARAGWTMIEKFDDGRVRLKRPASARANDAKLGFDPYRTWVGISQTRFALWIVGATLVAVFAFIFILVFVLDAAHRR
jgi:hypothetical protein